jgi:uncharacterized protein YjbI with pentapeptide repeats
MVKVDRVQKNFKGDRKHLELLLAAIEKEDINIWNTWRTKNLTITPLLSGINLSNANLENAILNNAILSEANFEGANLQNANLWLSTCEKANFSGANIHIANLARANLSKAHLVRANIGGGDVQSANLRDANLVYCTLAGTDLRESDLTGIVTHGWNVSDIIVDDVTCAYIFVDMDRKVKVPKDRNFEKGEFEQLIYKHNAINDAFLSDVIEKRLIKHVFISYVNEDYEKVNKLLAALESNGIKVWLDKEQLQPGMRWEDAIVNAIKDGVYFIACFSKNSQRKPKTFQRKEIRIALSELALMPDEKIWFIPVKFSECEIPHFRTNEGIDIASFQWVDLSMDWEKGEKRIIDVIKGY